MNLSIGKMKNIFSTNFKGIMKLIKSNKRNRIIFAVLVICIPIIIFYAIFSSLNSVKGKYEHLGGLTTSNGLNDCYYKFYNKSYIQECIAVSGDSDKNHVYDYLTIGKYKIENNEIKFYREASFIAGQFLQSTYEFVMKKEGKYLYNENRHFEEKIKDGNTVSQLLTINDKDYNGDIKYALNLKEDGRYELTCTKNVINIYTNEKTEETETVSGIYKRSGDVLILSQNGINNNVTYWIRDGFVYYSVLRKK